MLHPTIHWTHKYVATHPIPRYGKRHVITVTAGLEQIERQAPYFSVTADVRVPGQRVNVCGMLHDDVLTAFPDLAPVVALHLSTDDGVPMHAEANGWYWLAGALGGLGERYHGGSGTFGRTPAECLTIFAGHCRIPLDHAQRIATVVNTDDHPRSAWAALCDSMRDRWHQEAVSAIALLDTLIAKEGGR